jgi:hypothetical protein
MRCYSIVSAVVLFTAISALWQVGYAQCDVNELQQALSTAVQSGQPIRNFSFCNHEVVVDQSPQTITVTVHGPVVNTSRMFPRNASLQTELAVFALQVIDQINSGLSLSSAVPSTNAALRLTLRTFEAVVMPNVSPQAGAKQEEGREGERETKPGEVSTDVEYESFTFLKLDGSTLSFRGAFERTTDAGGLGFGVRLAYSGVKFEDNDNQMQSGEGTAFVKIPLGGIIEIGANVGGTVNRIEVAGRNQNVNSFGYGPFLAVRAPLSGGHVLAGGVLYQAINPNDSDDDLRILAYGAMGVLSVSEKLALSVEGFRMANLEIENAEDSFSVVHPQLHFYLTNSFGLILGYKTVLGIDDYDSSEFTLGSSIRF